MNALARDWRSTSPVAQGTCFHSALDTWASLRKHGELDWRIALGVVRDAKLGSTPGHVHAWIEGPGSTVISAVSGERHERATFYSVVGIDPDTVRLVNPRAIVRRYRGDYTRESVAELLNLWGRPWRIERGAVLAA